MNKALVSENSKIKRIFYGIFIPTLGPLCLGAWFSDFFLKRGLLFPIILIFMVGQTSLQVWMFLDCVNREFKNKNTKKNWMAAIFIGIVGVFIYFLKVKNKELDSDTTVVSSEKQLVT